MNVIEKFYVSVKNVLCIIRNSDLSLYNKLNAKTPKLEILRILGNGQSLLSANLGASKKVKYMVVNRHVLADNYVELTPAFYVLADPHFFSRDEGLNILKKIHEKTTWNMELWIPYSKHNKKLALKYIDKSNIKVCFYNCIPFDGFKSLAKLVYKKNLSCPLVQNVLVACIYIGICLHFKLIELYGVEHSWTKNLFVNDNNEVCLDNPHFYDKENINAKTWKEIQHEDMRLCEVLRAYANMFDSYFKLKDFANDRGVNIINCTKGSFIDAFEKDGKKQLNY
jgi:hypothetical protein